MARQLGRSVNSVAVNHRAVRRARSMKEFAAKLQVVNEEIDEAVHWLELLHESGLASHADLAELSREGHQLRAIFATARKTTRLRMRQ
jgi:four helix bundle protein